MPLSAYVASDFHIDKNPENITRLPPQHPDVPYIILAGDIGNVFNEKVIEFFENVRANYRIIFIAGNHDLYSTEPEFHVKRQIRNLIGADGYFLDDTSEIIEGVEVIGSTLWTDPSQYKNLFIEKGKYKYDIVQYLHENSRAFINHTLGLRRESEGRVLVTHYPISLRFKTKEWTEAHQSDPPEIEKRYFNNYSAWLDYTDVCIAGHTHYGAVFNVTNHNHQTLCLQNSVGHKQQRTKYESKRFIYVKKDEDQVTAVAKTLSEFSWK